MTLLQLKSFWTDLKSIFKSSKSDIEELNNTMIGLEKKLDKDTINGLLVIFAILMGLFSSTYYLLAGIKVGTLTFFIISFIFIVKAWKNVGTVIKWLDSRDEKLATRTSEDRIWSIARLVYVGYLFYYLVTTW